MGKERMEAGGVLTHPRAGELHLFPSMSKKGNLAAAADLKGCKSNETKASKEPGGI